jgi:hypothetical protein
VPNRQIRAAFAVGKQAITRHTAREIASDGKIIAMGGPDQCDEALLDPAHYLTVHSHLCTGTTLKEHSHGRAG